MVLLHANRVISVPTRYQDERLEQFEMWTSYACAGVTNAPAVRRPWTMPRLAANGNAACNPVARHPDQLYLRFEKLHVQTAVPFGSSYESVCSTSSDRIMG